MANEFVIKNGFFSQGTSNVTGNLTVTQTISGTTGQFTQLTSSIVSSSTSYSTFVGPVINPINRIGDTDAALINGVNYGTTNFSSTRTWTLPSTPTIGDSVKIKAPSNISTVIKLVISGSGIHTIDGDSSISLEAAYSAIECVYVTASEWRIF